jgi:hypothetical protein
MELGEARRIDQIEPVVVRGLVGFCAWLDSETQGRHREQSREAIPTMVNVTAADSLQTSGQRSCSTR